MNQRDTFLCLSGSTAICRHTQLAQKHPNKAVNHDQVNVHNVQLCTLSIIAQCANYGETTCSYRNGELDVAGCERCILKPD